MVVIQYICTTWEKSARGGKQAALRNTVKEGYPVRRKHGLPADAELVHILRFWDRGELGHIDVEYSVLPSQPSYRVGCVTIDADVTGLTAEFMYDRNCCGAPNRGWARKSVRIETGDWACFIYNGRFSSGWDAYWQYQKHVVNVGLFDSPDSRVFTSTPPSNRFECLAHLW